MTNIVELFSILMTYHHIDHNIIVELFDKTTKKKKKKKKKTKKNSKKMLPPTAVLVG